MSQPVVCDHVRRHDLERPLRETFTCRIHYCGVRYSDRKYTDPLVPSDVVPFFSRTKHDLARGYGNLDSGCVSQRIANHRGLQKKMEQLIIKKMQLPAYRFEVAALHKQGG